MDCALCFWAEAIFLPPIANWLITGMKTTPSHPKKTNKPQLFAHHTWAPTASSAMCAVCARDLWTPTPRCSHGSRPWQALGAKAQKAEIACVSNPHMHTCANSPRDGDAHPICQHSAKEIPSPHFGDPCLPSCLCSMTCEQTRSWLTRSRREALLCHKYGSRVWHVRQQAFKLGNWPKVVMISMRW